MASRAAAGRRQRWRLLASRAARRAAQALERRAAALAVAVAAAALTAAAAVVAIAPTGAPGDAAGAPAEPAGAAPAAFAAAAVAEAATSESTIASPPCRRAARSCFLVSVALTSAAVFHRYVWRALCDRARVTARARARGSRVRTSTLLSERPYPRAQHSRVHASARRPGVPGAHRSRMLENLQRTPVAAFNRSTNGGNHSLRSTSRARPGAGRSQDASTITAPSASRHHLAPTNSVPNTAPHTLPSSSTYVSVRLPPRPR
jgi:hypothetical protein